MTVEIVGQLIYDSKNSFAILFDLSSILNQVDFCRRQLLTKDELLLRMISKDNFYIENSGGIIFVYQLLENHEKAASPFLMITDGDDDDEQEDASGCVEPRIVNGRNERELNLNLGFKI